MPKVRHIEQRLIEAGVIQTGHFTAHNREEGDTKVVLDAVLAADSSHPELQQAIVQVLAKKLSKYKPEIVIPLPEGGSHIGQKLARHLGARAIMLDKNAESKELHLADQHERIVIANTSGLIVLIDDVFRTGSQVEEAVGSLELSYKKLVVGVVWDRRSPEAEDEANRPVESVVRRYVPMVSQ